MASISELFIHCPVFAMLLTFSAIIGSVFCYRRVAATDVPNTGDQGNAVPSSQSLQDSSNTLVTPLTSFLHPVRNGDLSPRHRFCPEQSESDNIQKRLWMKSSRRGDTSDIVIAIMRGAGENAIELSHQIDELIPLFELSHQIDMTAGKKSSNP
jgi:hypothetical protein